jgi:hypothetical protein
LFMLMLVFSFLVLSTFSFVFGKINLSMLWMNWCWSTKFSYRFTTGLVILKIWNKHSRRVLSVINNNNDGCYFCSSHL